MLSDHPKIVIALIILAGVVIAATCVGCCCWRDRVQRAADNRAEREQRAADRRLGLLTALISRAPENTPLIEGERLDNLLNDVMSSVVKQIPIVNNQRK